MGECPRSSISRHGERVPNSRHGTGNGRPPHSGDTALSKAFDLHMHHEVMAHASINPSHAQDIYQLPIFPTSSAADKSQKSPRSSAVAKQELEVQVQKGKDEGVSGASAISSAMGP